MHHNRLWLAFLAIVFAATLWYTGIATYHYYGYKRLTKTVSPITLEWIIVEQNEDDFTLKTNYSFAVNNISFSGTTEWQTHYLSNWAAHQEIQDLTQQEWKVWYDPTDPRDSSLQKNFPLKESASAVVLWGLFLYFLWLGYYVGSMYPKP